MLAAKKRNINSVFYLGRDNRKYNSVRNRINYEYLVSLASALDIQLFDVEKVNSSIGPVIQIEGDGWNGKNIDNGKKIALTYMADFAMNDSYKGYVDDVDHIVFPSKKLAEYYHCVSKKNVYLGSPKYDFKMMCRNDLCEKYNLDPNKKYALYAFPKIRDNSKVNTELIAKIVKSKGYHLLCKSRLKDTIPNNEKSHFYRTFYDVSWYPHTTMELLNISDFLINFESTTSKEAIMLKKPILDFKVKPDKNSVGERIATFKFLYDHKFYKNIYFNDLNNYEKILRAVNYLTDKENDVSIQKSLELCIQENFFNPIGTCDKILDLAFNVK